MADSKRRVVWYSPSKGYTTPKGVAVDFDEAKKKAKADGVPLDVVSIQDRASDYTIHPDAPTTKKKDK